MPIGRGAGSASSARADAGKVSRKRRGREGQPGAPERWRGGGSSLHARMWVVANGLRGREWAWTSCQWSFGERAARRVRNARAAGPESTGDVLSARKRTHLHAIDSRELDIVVIIGHISRSSRFHPLRACRSPGGRCLPADTSRQRKTQVRSCRCSLAVFLLSSLSRGQGGAGGGGGGPSRLAIRCCQPIQPHSAPRRRQPGNGTPMRSSRATAATLRCKAACHADACYDVSLTRGETATHPTLVSKSRSRSAQSSSALAGFG